MIKLTEITTDYIGKLVELRKYKTGKLESITVGVVSGWEAEADGDWRLHLEHGHQVWCFGADKEKAMLYDNVSDVDFYIRLL